MNKYYFKKEVVNMDLEIKESFKDGYNRLVRFNNWCVAVANGGKRFSKENFTKLERHLETDEVFVLLSGRGKLITGEEMKIQELEYKKLYNVKKGVWHGLILEKNATVLIIENDDTSIDNTEYKNIT